MGIKEIFPLRFFNKKTEPQEGDFTPTIHRVESNDNVSMDIQPEDVAPVASPRNPKGPAPD